jgi:PKD repeat protein
MSISITQGDYVLYQDTSLGNATGRVWNFPGGTPTGATAANPVVRYLSPSNTGFGAKLTITKGAINSIKNETNIIIVTPENISVALTSNVPAGTTIPMGTSVTYTAVVSTASLSY